MTAWLAADDTPFLWVEVTEANGPHEFVVDTGFNGSVYLPEDEITDWNLPFITIAPMTLADHSVIVCDVFEATIIWFSVNRRVSVVAGHPGCDSLLGMELLKGCRIELDDEARAVSIDQLT